jgi:hypothetical protein
MLSSSVRPTLKGGAEHDLGFDETRERVWKFTKNRFAGYAVVVDEDSLIMLPGAPLQYLDRWLIGNRIFSDDAELLGMVKTDEGSRIVISQQVIVGGDATWSEIEQYFVDIKGFRRIDPPGLDSCGGYQSRSYFRGRYAVFDVRPSNCIRTESGDISPIDVIPIVCSRGAATYLNKWIR